MENEDKEKKMKDMIALFSRMGVSGLNEYQLTQTVKKEFLTPEEREKKKKEREEQDAKLLVENEKIKFTYEKLVKGLKDGEFKKIVVTTGAGISVSAGIPDFRSEKTGLYANLEKYDLPRPEAIFDIDYFQDKPEAFYKLSNEFLDTTKFNPTPTHYFIKMLEDKGILRYNLTQNIDNLEEKTGLDMENKVVQAHGANRGATCSKCGKKQDRKELERNITAGTVMYCCDKNCGGPVKPNITFFGEGLPPKFFEAAEDISKEGEVDLNIVIGTALAVGPFNTTVDRCYKGGKETPQVLINLENTKSSGYDFENIVRYPQRMFIEGKCDDTIWKLVKDCGWEEDFMKYPVKKEEDKVDQQEKNEEEKKD